MIHTIGYKNGFIHLTYPHQYNNLKREVIRVQVDGYAYSIQVKSLHAAKITITKHENKIRGKK
jgi:competence protein ComGF